MKFQTKKQFMIEDFHPKFCKFGLDDIEFTETYGWGIEYIGYLKPLPTIDDETYLFYLEKIDRDGQIQTIHVLNENDTKEYQVIKHALRKDYNLILE